MSQNSNAIQKIRSRIGGSIDQVYKSSNPRITDTKPKIDNKFSTAEKKAIKKAIKQ